MAVAGGDKWATVPPWRGGPPSVTVGVGLKMYLGYDRTLAWCQAVKQLGLSHPALVTGSVELFVLPSHPVLCQARKIFAGTGVGLGAQNLHWEDAGAFTGEVSGPMLAELGCQYVEVGHARAKAHVRRDRGGGRPQGGGGHAQRARAGRLRRRERALLGGGGAAGVHRSAGIEHSACARESRREGAIIVAYEPVWAIGAEDPAPPGHIVTVCSGLKHALSARAEHASTVIYGGSARPGLLGSLLGSVDGLFLGRSAHDPGALEAVLSEACEVLA